MSAELELTILRQARWEGLPSAVPQPAKVDPILRRRLSPQGRLALALAETCLGDIASARTVFASRHGELARTHGLIEALRPESADDPSPSAFTLSVLNSTPAVLSIARKDTAPASAVSAGPVTAWMGLMEAALMRRESSGPVLFLTSDAPVPPVFLHGREETLPLRAAAALLAEGGDPWVLESGDRSPGSGDGLLALADAIEAGGGTWGGWSLRRR